MNWQVLESNKGDSKVVEGLNVWNQNNEGLKKEVTKKIKREKGKGFFGKIAEKFKFESKSEEKEFEEEAENLSSGSDDEGDAKFFNQKKLNLM